MFRNKPAVLLASYMAGLREEGRSFYEVGREFGYTAAGARRVIRWAEDLARRRPKLGLPGEALPKSKCGACGEMFTRKRAGAHYCTNACRQDAYRHRKAGRLVGEVKEAKPHG
jgi:hypothetical protein